MTPIEGPTFQQSSRNARGKVWGLRIGVAMLAALGGMCQVHAQTFTPLWSFGASGDGQLPLGTLIGRPDHLFGATLAGGASRDGTVYVLNQAGKEKVLYNFTGGADGGILNGPLVQVGRTLYGTTQIGGTTGNGVVFAVDSVTGKETTIYSFSDADGSPLAGLIYANGLLYGTTFSGGAANYGTAFQIDPTTGTKTILHSFGLGKDGNSPIGNLLMANNTLYGTTEIGGKHNMGTVYSLNPATGVETILYNLNGKAQGDAPQAGLVMLNGMLYGTASTGGSTGNGTVFQVDPATGAASTIHTFHGTSDGSYPLTEMSVVKGTLFGTADYGGSSNEGVLFSLSVPDNTFTVLHNFSGPDGEFPQGGLFYAKGLLYGTANAGGDNVYGTAFSLTLP